MIYELLFPLRHDASWLRCLNVLRYVPFRVIAATMTAMLLSFFVSPWFIRALKRKQIGQVVREDGPESHKIKSGTPTMGGALILVSVLVPTILWCDPHNVFVWATAAVTAGYGVIGYLDDYLKIKAKNSRGVPARYKLLGQFIIGGAVLGYAFLAKDHLPADWWDIRGRLGLPFVAFAKHPVTLPLAVYLPFTVLVVVWTSNSVNLTDGLDGLAIGPVIINGGTYLIWAYLAGATFGIANVAQHFVVARYLDIPPIASVGRAQRLLRGDRRRRPGFPLVQHLPGSGVHGRRGIARARRRPRDVRGLHQERAAQRILGGVFFLEAVSVVVQVASFKLTGKRIFLMAPIHHHYEKKGWPEPKIIVRFWIVSVLLALVGLSSLKLR